MSNGFDIKGRIDIDAGPAAKALRDVAENFVHVATNARSSEAAVSKAATGLKEAAAAAKLEAAANTAAAKAQGELNKKNQEARLISAKATGVNIATKNSKAITAGQTNLLDARAAAEGIKAQSMAEDTASKIASRNLRDQVILRKENEAAQRRVNAAQEAGYQQLASTRYALYDVAQTLGVAGAALMAIPIATAAVAIAWERDFANVQRTVGGTPKEVNKLRDSFIDLVQSVPQDWGTLTEIGTLAGQLGVASAQIAPFTKVVAQFSMATGVSVDETATAFGRLNSLVPDVKGNYQKLADSVLNVGVNSVATEQAILRTATQLSFLGTQTTLTSDQIIGLSGALASVAVSPELSRSLTARLFAIMGQAAQEGGAKLEEFGRIAGMSGKEFSEGYKKDTGDVFLKFMRGIAQEGSNANTVLTNLGIGSIRDRPGLIRLAQAADSSGVAFNLLAESFDNAKDSSGELARQYEIQAGTVSAKIQLLVNNFQALMNAAGEGGLGPIGAVLDFFISKLQELTDFAQTDVGGWVVGLGLAITGLTGALALVGAAAATGLAGYMAIILALRGIQTSAGGASISLGAMNGLLAATGPLGAKAAAGIRLIGTAIKALSLVGLAVAIPEIFKGLGGILYDLTVIDKSFDNTVKRFSGSVAFKVGIDSDIHRTMREMGESIGIFAFDGQRDLQRLQEGFEELAAAGDLNTLKTQMEEFMDATDYSLERVLKEMPGLTEAFDSAGISVRQWANGQLEFTNAATGMSASGADVSSVLSTIEEAAAASEAAIKEAAQALLEFNGTAITAEQAEIKFQTALNSLTAAAKEADVSIDGTNAASLDFRSSLLEAEAAARTSAQAIIDNGGSVEDAMGKYNAMRDAIINEVAAKTGSMDTARAWADRVLGTTAEARAAIQNYSGTVNAMPANKSLTISAPTVTTVKQGVEALIGVLDNFNGKTYTAKVYTEYAGTGTLPPGISGPPSPKVKGFSGGQFYEGGFTGIGGKYQPAGVVHKGEYVMPAYSVQALGTSYFDNIRRATQKGYATGGSVAGVVQGRPSYGGNLGASGVGTMLATMDAQSIQALAAAISNLNIALYTSDRVIAESASRGAQGQTQIGTN